MANTPMKVEVPKDFIHTTGILNEDLTVSKKPALETPTGSQQSHSPATPVFGKQ